jgi:hypothetical protein
MLNPRTAVRDLEALLTEEDIHQLKLCQSAEADGDAARALEHYYAAPYVDGLPHPHHLYEIVDLAEHAPGWVWSRWITGQAYRWMLAEEDQRVNDAVAQTIVVSYPDLDLDRPMGLETGEFATRLAASHWMCGQLATYEYGGLADFLDLRAGPFLERRADQVREWASALMNGYRLGRVVEDRIALTDLRTGDPREALNIGALAERPDGTCVLGRLVPIAADPGWMFESRPVTVPEDTAAAAASLVTVDEPAAWVCAVGDACRAGVLAPEISAAWATPLSCDLVPDSWVGGPGVDVESAVGACEVAVLAARVSPVSIERTAAHVTTALMNSRVFAEMRRSCPSADDADIWQRLAGCTPEPVRGRCLELARLCRAAA